MCSRSVRKVRRLVLLRGDFKRIEMAPETLEEVDKLLISAKAVFADRSP